MPTENAQQLAATVKRLAPGLKAIGFRKRRHTFNRRTPAGLTHVIMFQASPSPPPGHVDPPGWISTPVGQVAVNLGVFVPGMRTEDPRREWFADYHCQLRTRLDDPPSMGEGRWWPVDSPATSSEIDKLLNDQGLPWLDQFSDAAAVIHVFRRRGRRHLGMEPAAAVDVAALLVSLDRRPEAEKLLRPYLARCDHKPHLEYLSGYLPTIGLGHLVTEL